MSKHGFKTTGWFPGHVKPVRIGIYERKFGFVKLYCRWDGNHWHFGWHTLMGARNYKSWTKGLPHQEVPWRGITAKEYRKAMSK